MSRNGKIARLPRPIRDELNRRLDDGEPGAPLLAWLNALPDVQGLLQNAFGARPINPQNLSEWRQGGFRDWQRHQDSREWALLLVGQADDIGQAAGPMPLSDRVTLITTLTLGKQLFDLSTRSLDDPATRAAFLRLLPALSRLRRSDLDALRFRMELAGHQLPPLPRLEPALPRLDFPSLRRLLPPLPRCTSALPRAAPPGNVFDTASRCHAPPTPPRAPSRSEAASELA